MMRMRYATNAQLCAAATVGLAAVGATGWVAEIPYLTQVHPSFIPIAPSTVFAFALIGSGIYLRERWPEVAAVLWWYWIAALIVLVSSVILAAQAFDVLSSDVEDLVFGTFGVQGGVPTGRMSSITAILFVLSSVAALLQAESGERPAPPAAGFLASAVTLSGCTLLLAYAMGTPVLYGMGVIPPALITSLCFFFTGLGLLARLGPSTWPLREFTGDSMRATLLRTFLPFVFCVVILEGWFDHYNHATEIQVNPAVSSALWAMLLAVLTATAVVVLARRLGAPLDASQAALRESLDVTRTLLNATTDIVLLARPDGTVIACNEAAATSLGTTRDELVGKSAFDFMPEHLASSRKAYGLEVARTGAPVQFDDERDGRVFQTRVFPIRDAQGVVSGLAIFTHDVTAARQGELALRASETLFRSLTEHSYDVITMADRDGRILYDSPAITRTLGYSAEERVGKLVFDYAVPEARDAMRTGYEDFTHLTGRAMHHEGLFLHKDGTRRAIESVCTNLLHEPAVAAIVVNFRDITERKTMEEELWRSHNLESLGLLAGGIAHDFNNVLTGVVGNLSVLESVLPADSEAHDIAVDARLSADRAKALTGQLMTFARGGAPVKETASIEEIVREVTALILSGSRTRAEFQFAPGLRPVEIDRSQIGQVVQNLVLNADHAMLEGGTVRISARNVEVTSNDSLPLEPGAYVRVSVVDHGIGIPAQALNRVFDPYFTTKSTGHGLGLSIAHSIIQRHNGHISVSSEPDQGSRFDFWLPASQEEIVARIAPAETPANTSAHVLLVDDQQVIHTTMRRMLARLGCTMESAFDGREAIEKYEAAARTGTPFDVVVMDLTIPGDQGGKEIAARLLEGDPDAKVVVASGYATDPVLAHYADYGFTGAISKPFQLESLAQAISAALDDDG